MTAKQQRHATYEVIPEGDNNLVPSKRQVKTENQYCPNPSNRIQLIIVCCILLILAFFIYIEVSGNKQNNFQQEDQALKIKKASNFQQLIKNQGTLNNQIFKRMDDIESNLRKNSIYKDSISKINNQNVQLKDLLQKINKHNQVDKNIMKNIGDLNEIVKKNNKQNEKLVAKLARIQQSLKKVGGLQKTPKFQLEEKKKIQNMFVQARIKEFIAQSPEQKKIKKQAAKFLIPKRIWLFNSKTKDKLDYLERLYLQNIRKYTSESGYQLTDISLENAESYLSSKNKNRLKQLNLILDKHTNQQGLNQKKNEILSRAITLMIAEDNGGVIINEYLALTESLKWLEDIGNNWHCNKGNPGIKPQVFGFYLNDHSSRKIKQNKFVTHEVEKYMTLFPNLEYFFFASIKGSEYISNLIDNFIYVVDQQNTIKRLINRKQLNSFEIDLKDYYGSVLSLASQLTIQKKQKHIDSLNINSKFKKFAIDYYGYYSMNSWYFPLKLKHMFEHDPAIKTYQHLAFVDYNDFLASIGPMRYLVIIYQRNYVNSQLLQATKGKTGIMKNSFLQKYLFPELKQIFLYDNPQHQIDTSKTQQWSSLPKLIWVYWDSGYDNMYASNKLCVQNMKRMSQQNGFKTIIIDDNNAKNYLDASVINHINNAIANAKITIKSQTKSDLYRLSIIAKYGGIYMDSTHVLLQNFDWLINIAKYPEGQIFNRFGKHPKVVMIHHPQWKAPPGWTINIQHNTKQQWFLAYQSSWIAAEAHSQFIKSWYDELVSYIVNPYSVTSQKLIDCGVSEYKWTTDQDQYLVVMDSVKCVVGRKQIQLKNSNQVEFIDASDYYKIWSISSYNGQHKLRHYLNYDFDATDKFKNLFIYHYSQEYVESIIGKVNQLFKFFDLDNKIFRKFLQQNIENLESQYHPNSFFAKYIYNKDSQILQKINGKIALRLKK